MPFPFGDIGREVVRELGGSGAVLRRFGPGGYNDSGRYIETPPYDMPLTASVQPVMPRRAIGRPEGAATSEEIEIYSTKELMTHRVSSSGKADHILWQGQTYEVHTVSDWRTQAGYYRSVAKRLGP